MAGFWNIEDPSIAAAGIPSAPTGDPSGYLEWLLRYQQPLGGPGVTLATSYHWQFDSLTDLVSSETLSVSGTVPLTSFVGGSAVPVPPTLTADSQLVTGFATFDAVADSLVASSSTVQDVTSSALFVWCARYPTSTAGTMGVLNKREAAGDFIGWETGITAADTALATLDGGAAQAALGLSTNDVAETADGVWHWYALLIDNSIGFAMLGSDEDISAWIALPAGTLSNAINFSIGAGRLQAQPMDVLCQMSFMGPQVEGLFGSPTEAESVTNDPKKPNIRDHVCSTLALDTVRAVVAEPTL
jgi:hypothetical protein